MDAWRQNNLCCRGSAQTRDQTPREAGATASHGQDLPQEGLPCGTTTPLLSWLTRSISCHTEGKRVGRYTTQAVVDDVQAHGQLPPLEPGDRLTRAEFERRYEAMPQGTKAELIEGAVHMPSPARFHRHGRPQAQPVGWLIYYVDI